jgi:Fe2+ or Zn2+ uptake regulation protein
MSYAEILRAHRRLTILRILSEAPGHAANESILADGANALGVATTRAQARTELAWLEEQGLVALEDLGGLTVASLTEHGAEVAAGRAAVPGVKRPGPGARG